MVYTHTHTLTVSHNVTTSIETLRAALCQSYLSTFLLVFIRHICTFVIFICEHVFCLHVYLRACIVLRKPDVRSSGTGATDGCKPLCSCWGSNHSGRVASECFYPLSHLDPETHLMDTVVAPHNNLKCSRKMLLWTDVVFGSHVERSSVSQLPISRNLHCLLLISQCHAYVLRFLSELPFLFLARVSPQTRSQKIFLVHVHLILLTLHPTFMSWHGRHFKVYVQVQVLWKRKRPLLGLLVVRQEIISESRKYL